jgi:hypothetical protein
MTETVKEPNLQTKTAVGKVLVTDDSTTLLLGLLGFSATKLWNTTLWHAKECWKTTGKIPSYAKMDVSMKQEHPLWYRRLCSQSARPYWKSFGSHMPLGLLVKEYFCPMSV